LVAAELWAAASAGRQREGLAARATEAARKSKELAGLCEGAQTAPLTWAIATVPLSRRERETAEMAAKGATNAQIAETLTVSIRTVESHLYAAFAKLGVTDRSQLSQALQAE
jgi:DNA-binding CsgD family transcriptional regulator